MTPQAALVIFVVVQITAVLWLAALSYFAFRALQTYQFLTRGLKEKDVAAILKELKKKANQLDTQYTQTSQRLDQLEQDLKPYIQKIGFHRYNPFGNTGGDQSFSLCLLDQQGNGILLTSLHARAQTRLYSKEILGFKPKEDTELSTEEQHCLQVANQWS